MDLANRVSFWVLVELARFRGALRSGWRRILVGAFVGWLAAVVLGAVGLALLEAQGVVSRETSDELAIVIVLYGVGLGALNGHALRPAARRIE